MVTEDDQDDQIKMGVVGVSLGIAVNGKRSMIECLKRIVCLCVADSVSGMDSTDTIQLPPHVKKKKHLLLIPLNTFP